ncbi:hypothetical protein GQ53DRAFT_743163 [Thozetella sp. PMI_491]|nr:hypothetical protein GQ53DRAFT_743163 [Thozetella sp. PMI_491]
MAHQHYAYTAYPEVTRTDFPELSRGLEPWNIKPEQADEHGGFHSRHSNPLPSPKPSPKPLPKPKSAIRALPRRLFWILVAIFAVGCLVFLGIGIGAGVALKGHSDGSISSSSSSISCPSSHGTTYTLSDSGTTFMVLCGRDYTGNDTATDIKNTPVNDIYDCMRNCRGRALCTGATFATGDSKCWMKTALNLTAPTYRTDANFIVRLN